MPIFDHPQPLQPPSPRSSYECHHDGTILIYALHLALMTSLEELLAALNSVMLILHRFRFSHSASLLLPHNGQHACIIFRCPDHGLDTHTGMNSALSKRNLQRQNNNPATTQAVAENAPGKRNADGDAAYCFASIQNEGEPICVACNIECPNSLLRGQKEQIRVLTGCGLPSTQATAVCS